MSKSGLQNKARANARRMRHPPLNALVGLFWSSPTIPRPLSNVAARLGPVSASMSTSLACTSPNRDNSSSRWFSRCLVGRSTAEPFDKPSVSSSLFWSAAATAACVASSSCCSSKLRRRSSAKSFSRHTSALSTASIAEVSSPVISCSTYSSDTLVGIGTSRRAM